MILNVQCALLSYHAKTTSSIEIFVIVCGISRAIITPLVIGGYQPNTTEFPWHASLYLSVSQDKPKEFFCGASIIQENLLITAAHCIYDEDIRQVIDPKKIYIATGNIFRDYDFPSPHVTTNQVCKFICNTINLYAILSICTY